VRFALKLRDQWLYEHGDVDPSTGEIIPAIRQESLLLEPSLPFPADSFIWKPESVTITVNGRLESQWILFLPEKFYYFQHRGNRCRAIGAQIVAHNGKFDNGATVRGIVWCAGANTSLDEVSTIGKYQREKPYNIGLTYARLISQSEGGAFEVFISRFDTQTEFETREEWLRHCHSREEA
jgi:hypothetical protein